MESLVTKLENEVGLTHEQAKQVVGCVRSYMAENDLDVDWEEFFETKTKKLSDKAKQAWTDLTGNSQNWGEKVDNWASKAQDTLDDLSVKAQQAIKDVCNKTADFISDKD